MIDTRLILVEGIPGSGKSTTAQFISHSLQASGVVNKWWYEEEAGHPVYLFDSDETMLQIIEDLKHGNYRKIAKRALERWKRFSDYVQDQDNVILIESTFFGYITWTLFPLDVPIPEIGQYLTEVERLIAPCNPVFIYFYQNGIDSSLKKICKRRGRNTEERFIRNACESQYGRSRKLAGFEGMVSFWKDYRLFTDSMFEKIRVSKLSIENSEGKWEEYQQQITEFLKIPTPQKLIISTNDLDGFIGSYGSGESTCEISRIESDLFINGMKHVWQNSKLLPRNENEFEVESLPIKLRFDSNKLIVSGPRLLEGEIGCELVRQ